MPLDYKAIGARVREARFQQKVSQEKLAEWAELSLTHMSHIETGSTKVSLPSLVKVANALGVSLDELVCDSLRQSREIYQDELSRITVDCSEKELRILTDTVKALKEILRRRKYEEFKEPEGGFREQERSNLWGRGPSAGGA